MLPFTVLFISAQFLTLLPEFNGKADPSHTRDAGHPPATITALAVP
jgi:hypothetical protein